MDILSGVRIDPRPQTEKEVDYKHETLYAGMPAVWVEKTKDKWYLPKQRFQDGSYSCVAQSSATAIEVLTDEVISALPYKLREGGGQGMWLKDIGNILYHTGTTLEDKGHSQNMNDAEIDSAPIPKWTLKVTGYRTMIDFKNIDVVAEAIQAYGHCVLTFESNSQEWQLTPQYFGQPITFAHAICAVDFFTLNGIKYLLCRDSAGQNSSPEGYRLITQDYLTNRCTGCIYFLGAKLIPPVVEPPIVTPPVVVIPPVEPPKVPEPTPTTPKVPEVIIEPNIKESFWKKLFTLLLSLFNR